ncbi:ornithine carbamoyltransferase [Canibacter oris]|uniref:Ornithine carbamoyltransferase n=1 Tax=Canibacter oris TaxID=1365628 RepID=A0A840DPS8_9MICO|nr:ornithine carbamoyltransferase [Canibacter oris]MBB4071998.1 ornithine carbamoyltransferase [Canibacter oris]
MVRHFLRDDDLTTAEQQQVLKLAAALKADRYGGSKPLAGPRTAIVMFDKTSTRTRLSFAAGIAELGGEPLIINPGEAQLGAKESIADTARVFSRMASLVVWRTDSQQAVVEMAEHSSIPVINALTDDFHPCQILADLLTIMEHKGQLAGLTAAYLGDTANNMANSYLLGLATAGMHVRLAGPAAYQPAPAVLQRATEIARGAGGSIAVGVDPAAAISGADVVITDTWVSMGQEAEKAARVKAFTPYQVTAELMRQAQPDAIFMHCLPAYRGYEVAADVIDGPQSVIWDEAENRLHAQKALMTWLLEHTEN